MKAVRKAKTGQQKRTKSESRVAGEDTRPAWQRVMGAEQQIAELQSDIADAEIQMVKLRRAIAWAKLERAARPRHFLQLDSAAFD